MFTRQERLIRKAQSSDSDIYLTNDNVKSSLLEYYEKNNLYAEHIATNES